MSPRRSLLDPHTNFGLDVTVHRRTHELNEFGETVTTDEATEAKAVWVELGYKQRRTKEGRRIEDMVEVHLLPEHDGLVPGQDFIEKDGVRYRIVEYLGMVRMVSVVQYTIMREDK